MRWLLMVGFALAVGCTKPNPNRCCKDEADCTAKEIPVGSTCEQGLVCRGNQCIAQPCTASGECDGAAPYCVAELCAEACDDDAQCPGFGQTGLPYCDSGACVACTVNEHCSGATPVCDTGSCRECRTHAECGSDLCDIDLGTCIAETATAYATPSGSTTSACTKSEPCTLERALDVVDASRPNVRLYGGMYESASSYTFDKTVNLALYGAGDSKIGEVGISLRGPADFKVRDLATGGLECTTPDPTKPRSSVDVARVETGVLYARRCDVKYRHVRQVAPLDINAISLLGNTNADGSTLDMEFSEIVGGNPGIYVYDASSVSVRNSIIREQGIQFGSIRYELASAGASTISFTTFYNTYWACSDGPLVFESSNNVFLNERADAPANTVSGTHCRHTYSLIKPQSATPAGSNNLLNVDPRFVNGAGGDFHLIAGSPAIDAADPAATNAVDLEGTARPQGAGRDLGAFEYKP